MITPSTRIAPSYLEITFPASFSTSGLSCSTWDCTLLANSLIRVNAATASEMGITITGLIAPNEEPTQYVRIRSFTAAGDKIDESINDVIFSAKCDLPCRTCSSTNTSSCLTCYSNTDISVEVLLHDAGDFCYEVCPDSTYENTLGTKCLDCSSVC